MQTGMRDDRGRNLLRASRSSTSAQCYHAAFSYWAREASNYEIPGNVPMILLPINMTRLYEVPNNWTLQRIPTNPCTDWISFSES